MQKLIIEARVNEFMMSDQGNSHVPYTSQEIVADAIACRNAGAAVLTELPITQRSLTLKR